MAFMIIFYLVAYFAIFGYLVVSAVKNYKRGKKRTAKGFAFLICIFAYFTFHFLFFEFGTLNDDTKWQYRVKNDSSVENPQILFEFQKLYVKDVINPREFVFDCHSSSEYFISIISSTFKKQEFLIRVSSNSFSILSKLTEYKL